QTRPVHEDSFPGRPVRQGPGPGGEGVADARTARRPRSCIRRSRPMNVLQQAPPALFASSSEPGLVDESALCAERPFPGLRPFAFADRHYFFGRESQIYALYRLVEHGRFIAVIGSLGSGQSSLGLAGLCRVVAEESEDPGGPHWV